MVYKTLRPAQVLLDPENPRLPDGTSNDKEAINWLLDEGFEAMVNLAKDLVDQGEGNPTELPIVMASGRKWIALEGNRRFAALKLLADPNLADKPERRLAFKRLAARGQPPKSLYCAVATSREQFDHWIVLKHTGANGGVSTRGWSPEQSAKHRQRAKGGGVDSGTARSLVIAKELQEAYARDPELVELIRAVRADKLTNIGRLFTPEVLTRLHLSIRNSTDLHVEGPTLWARHNANDLHEFFWWAFETLRDHSVDAFKNATLRAALLSANTDVIPSHALASDSPSRLADRPYVPAQTGPPGGGRGNPGSTGSDDGSGTGGAGGGSGASGQGGRTGGSGASGRGGGREATPAKYLYSDVRLPKLSRRIQLLLKECRALVIDDHPGTACVMARVMVELVVSSTDVLAWTGSHDNLDLGSKIKAAIGHLDPFCDKPRKANKELAQAFQEAGNIAYLNAMIHNPHARPDPHLARRFDAAFTPLLVAINAELAGSSA